MKIDLIDENTYALYDGDVQIEQGPITQEMRDEAKRKKQGIRTYIANLKKVKVETVLAVPVEGETVVVVPEHDHAYDERYSPADHDHPYKEHGHPHSHEEMDTLKAAIEQESQLRYKADQEQEGRYKSHLHPELAQAFHTHSDIYETFNVINNRITAVEASIPKDIQPHQHNDLHERLNTVTSEITSLRNLITSIETRVQDGIDNMVGAFNARLETLQPKGEYITREEYNPLTEHKRTYRVKVKSSQKVDGDLVQTLEEI